MPNHCTITELNCLSNYTLKYHIVKPISKAANETLPASQFGPDIPQSTILRKVFRASYITCKTRWATHACHQKITLIGWILTFAGFHQKLANSSSEKGIPGFWSYAKLILIKTSNESLPVSGAIREDNLKSEVKGRPAVLPPGSHHSELSYKTSGG